MAEKKSTQIYHDWIPTFDMIGRKDKAVGFDLIMSLLRHGASGEGLNIEEQSDAAFTAEVIFNHFASIIDHDIEKYMERCELNAKNGAKGGRPKKQTDSEKTERFFEKPKKADKDKDKDKDNSSLLYSNPDFYFSSDKTKVFEIYENECKNLIPLTGEKRNRKVLDKTSNFLNEIEFDWDYFKNLCQKANELKTIANTKIDFEMLINCHIGIMNGKYHKDENKRGVSQEFIDNFFENLKKEEAQNE